MFLQFIHPNSRASLEGLREVRDSGSNLTKTLKQQDGDSLCDLDFYQQVERRILNFQMSED